MTKIEWVKNPDNETQGITVNSKTGCVNGCEYCYARKLAHKRLKPLYLANKNYAPIKGISYKEYRTLVGGYNDPFYPRYWPERLDKIKKIKKPTGIFLDDMSDWMGDYWPKEWTEQELQVMRDCPQHRFYTLTKQPQNLPQWSPFPENCYVGVTVTEGGKLIPALDALDSIQCRIRYLSIEPMLGNFHIPDLDILLGGTLNWLIIGACTGTMKDLLPLHHKTNLAMVKQGNKWTLQPQIEWLEEIVRACDKAGIPIFLKDNLFPLFKDKMGYINKDWLRQEMPR